AEEIAEKAKVYSGSQLTNDDLKLPRRKITASFIDPTVQLIFKLLKKLITPASPLDVRGNRAFISPRWPALEGKGGLLVSRLLRRAGLTPSPALFILCFFLDQTGRLRSEAALV
ncbi:MAG: hypothetical protein R6U55_06235, partial [Desulfovermiculus sp.]